MTTHSLIGARVRRMRILAGLGQIELGHRLGVASGTVSMVETGKVEAGPEMLSAMAKEFDCTSEYLLRPPIAPVTSRPWLRAYADASQRALDAQMCDVETAVEAALTLGVRRLDDVVPVLGGVDDSADVWAIESLASDTRAAAGVAPDSPVGNAIRAAERLGCLVLPMVDELGRHLGLSARIAGIPVICVSRPHDDPERAIPGDRQRFTVAHELGHLAMHTGLAPPTNVEEARALEKQAHRFAAAFLAPGDAMLDELDRHRGRVTLTTLTDIKSRWGVSVKALIGRMRDLQVIDDDQARSLFKQISARGWNKNEPVKVGNEAAQWMAKAVGSSARRSPNWLEASGLGKPHFDRWSTWTPVPDDRTDAVVLPMRSHNRRR